MNTLFQSRWVLEFLSWVITVVMALLIVLPIVNNGIVFPFIDYNIFYIITGLTIFRYIFFWSWLPFSESKAAKVVLVFLVPLVFFPLLEGIHTFVEYNDQEGIQSILNHLSLSKFNFFVSYIRLEYLLFGIMSFLGSFLLAIKMIRSLWRQINER
jgi:hypothetical protein